MDARDVVVNNACDHCRCSEQTLAELSGDASYPRVVLMGRPGSGKGTQGPRLAQRLGVQYLSTGDLLRHEIATRTPLGRAIERLVNSGQLLPAGLIEALVATKLNTRGYVLDGVPRTVTQAEALFERSSPPPEMAINLTVPSQVALARMLARRRRDDDPAVARDRLATFEAETAPAIEWLDRRGLIFRVDGDDLPDVVHRRMWRAYCHYRRSARGDLPPAPAEL